MACLLWNPLASRRKCAFEECHSLEVRAFAIADDRWEPPSCSCAKRFEMDLKLLQTIVEQVKDSGSVKTLSVQVCAGNWQDVGIGDVSCFWCGSACAFTASTVFFVFSAEEFHLLLYCGTSMKFVQERNEQIKATGKMTVSERLGCEDIHCSAVNPPDIAKSATKGERLSRRLEHGSTCMNPSCRVGVQHRLARLLRGQCEWGHCSGSC